MKFLPYISLLLALLLSINVHAQNSFTRDTLKMSIYFRSNITTPTAESRRNIERALSALPSATSTELIIVEGWASPEGTEETNAKLAMRRANAAELLLREYIAFPERVSKYSGTDWGGLIHYSEKQFSQEDVRLIKGAMEKPASQRKTTLSTLHKGTIWKKLNSDIFPSLRRADISIIYRTYKPEPATVVTASQYITVSQRDTVVVFHKDTVYYLPVDKRRDPLRIQALYPKLNDKLRRPVTAFRSNLLLPLFNVGVELPASNRWSIAADFYYPWCPREWMNKWTGPQNAQMHCLQGIGGFIEGRLWFGMQHRNNEPSYAKYRLLGHSLGLIAGAAYYDLEYNGSGQRGEILAAGLGYTYALPVGKKGGIHLEFEIAAGAVYRVWHPYDVHEPGGYLLYHKDENNISIRNVREWRFCPIKAGFNLVVPIFTDKPLKTSKKEKNN